MRKERSLHELYESDWERGDALTWGRSSGSTRRGFLRGSGLVLMQRALGSLIPYARLMPAGLIPISLAAGSEPISIAGKDGLTVLSERPFNAETPAHLLDDERTPISRLFVRNNGLVPEPVADPGSWLLHVDGEACERATVFSLRDLQDRFKHYSYRVQMECGGNGRSEFDPPAPGNQWTVGAIGCAQWSGVRVKDVLGACGIASNAIYVAYYGADRHLSGDPDIPVISRGAPMHKALEDESLLAWAVNGEPLPMAHGHPLRLVVGGWPGSVSGKWVRRLSIRDRVHDGPKMTGRSYRVPCEPVAPGSAVADSDMCIIESMPVKSLITFPRSGIEHPRGRPLAVRGHAWAGDLRVKRMHVSIDFGASWQRARLERPVNRLAWQRWRTEVRLPTRGYYEIWARAVDEHGNSQPMVVPAWNPKGYLNNACHRIAVRAA